MNVATELIQYNEFELDDLKNELKQNGFEIAYGSTYSIQEIHKAITDSQPAFVKINNDTVYIVGEDEDSLIAYRNGELFEMLDTSLKKAWTGEAVIVLDKKQQQTLQKATIDNSPEEIEVPDFVIFPCERDNWNVEDEERKQISKRQIARVKYLPTEEKPIHPVIVTYRKPDADNKRKGHRAANNGIEIELYDISDPFTEFLHELGHIYWNTRLTEEEKNLFNNLQSKLSKTNLPAIFIADWDWENGTEIFCTIYYWYLKGKLSHDGYIKILDKQYPEGYAALLKVLERIRNEIESKEIMKAQQKYITKTWADNEREIALWLNYIDGRPSMALVKGQKLIKCHIPPKSDILPYKIPENLNIDILGEHNKRKWVLMKEGILKGRVLVLKADCLDVQFMKSRKNYYLVPQTRVFLNGGKRYNRIVYVTPKRLLKTYQESLKRQPINNKIDIVKRETKSLIDKVQKLFYRIKNG